MGGFNLTPGDLDALAKHIADVNQQTQGTLRGIRNAADGVATAWSGVAATAFQKLIERFQEDANKVQEALMEICSQISSSSEVYKRNEEEQQGSIGTIANRL
ncbi:WXG100 family type VII secretion target [Lentzea sp. NPDC051838]|uniref:WXG100 family type VII secretion target n=1 Tax=Lentzea sp. NPDC051838 TaxID=3154849 RepID=UPI0034322E7A